jgi:SNF2 family DNA or RNA helicase
VFSQWTRLLDLLEVLLNDIDLHFLRLDGSTPVKVMM